MKIQYLTSTKSNGNLKTITVASKRLIPFHGNHLDDYDHDDIAREGWCERLMKKYLIQQQGSNSRSKFDAKVERRYLQDVLKDAKRLGGYNNTSDNDEDDGGDDIVAKKSGNQRDRCGIEDSSEHVLYLSNDDAADRHKDEDVDDEFDDDDSLEEPYTQAVVDYNSDDELNTLLRKDNSKGIEPIRPGDVIEYCNPIFIQGRYVQVTTLNFRVKRSQSITSRIILYPHPLFYFTALKGEESLLSYPSTQQDKSLSNSVITNTFQTTLA